MKIALGCDHGGFLLKESIIKYLTDHNYEIIDVGTNSCLSCNYPEFGIKCAELVATGAADKGIVICSSGEGIMISANKVKGIRCGLVYNEEIARLIVQHNNCNMMALGAKFTTYEEAVKYIDIFLNTKFEGERHLKRINIIMDYEKN